MSGTGPKSLCAYDPLASAIRAAQGSYDPPSPAKFYVTNGTQPHQAYQCGTREDPADSCHRIVTSCGRATLPSRCGPGTPDNLKDCSFDNATYFCGEGNACVPEAVVCYARSDVPTPCRPPTSTANASPSVTPATTGYSMVDAAGRHGPNMKLALPLIAFIIFNAVSR